jgi:hypothetical protein
LNPSVQIEPVSADHLLTCLDLAIDEAKLVRSLIKSKDMAFKLKEENPFSDTLLFLNVEIPYLEAKLIQVRSMANRN